MSDYLLLFKIDHLTLLILETQFTTLIEVHCIRVPYFFFILIIF